MKTITCMLIFCGLSWQLIAQVPVSQIEGYLEVYHPEDNTSIYLGKDVARNMDNTVTRGNTFVGYRAGYSDSSGMSNAFFGNLTGYLNLEGVRNSFFGSRAGEDNTTGSRNSFYGYRAGNGNTTGSRNSFFGYRAGDGNTTGSKNSIFGYDAGVAIQGESNILLGHTSGPPFGNGNVSYRLYIDVNPSNDPLIYGEFDNDLLRVNGTFQVIGDGDNLGGVFNANEVISRYKNINGTSDHSAISVDGRSGKDAIVYLAEEGDAYWDLRHDVSQNREFQIRYQGGDNNNDKPFRLDTFGNLTITGTYFPSSDLNRKEAIQSIDQYDILSKVLQLPITEWQYRGEPIRHIGPMAQDFYAAFGLGQDETTIATIDADGVALAAIQAQQELIEELQTKNRLLEAEYLKLQVRIENLEDKVNH